jgi:hypothetical protein
LRVLAAGIFVTEYREVVGAEERAANRSGSLGKLSKVPGTDVAWPIDGMGERQHVEEAQSTQQQRNDMMQR